MDFQVGIPYSRDMARLNERLGAGAPVVTGKKAGGVRAKYLPDIPANDHGLKHRASS